MAKNVYVPPRRNVRIKSGGNIRITSSHQKSKRKNENFDHDRAVHPDEAQQEASTELNPVYVLPNGQINYWAGITTSTEPITETEDDPEDK